MVKNNQKNSFYAVLGYFGAILEASKRLKVKRVYKGPKMSRIYGPMSKRKNKPLTKSLWTQKRYAKDCKSSKCVAQCLSLKISP
jgi:hypothetical protein